MTHLSELLPELNLKRNPPILNITQDSRKLQAGDLFIACPGLQQDGRHFMDAALEKKAAAILYESGDGYQLPGHLQNLTTPLVGMPHLNQKIGVLASRFYQNPTENLTVIGVTGTNGKTSVSHFIAQSLNHLQHRCAYIGTLGTGFLPNLQTSGYTTPDSITLQKQFSHFLTQKVDHVAMEVSSHSLSQHRVNGVHFTGAIFTNLTRDHLDYHGNMENYGAAKAQLFQFPGLKFAVYNADDIFGMKLLSLHPKNSPAIVYSADKTVNRKIPAVIAEKITPTESGFALKVSTPWGSGDFHVPLMGRFNLSNVLAVLATLGALNVPLDTIFAILAVLKPVNGRMQCLGGGSYPKIIVDYAHTPDALLKVLQSLREHAPKRLWCVFGCGGNRDRGKRAEMAAIAEQYSDEVIITNDNPRHESPLAILTDIQSGLQNKSKPQVELDRAKAIQQAIRKAHPDDIILVAGKGHETEQIIGDQVLPFSDIHVIKSFING